MQNMAEGPQEVINDIAINPDGVLVSVTDTGKLNFWDFDGSHRFQTLQTKVQPGSLDAEAGIFACTFDKTGTRLMTCEADKTIKVWAEVKPRALVHPSQPSRCVAGHNRHA